MTDWTSIAKQYGMSLDDVISTLKAMRKANVYHGAINGKLDDASRKAYELFKKLGYSRSAKNRWSYKPTQTTNTQTTSISGPKPGQSKLGYIWSGNGKKDDAGLAGRFLNTTLDSFGVKDLATKDIISGIGEFGAYAIPYVGTGLALNDAYESAKKGDWFGAGTNALFAIPVIGGIGKGLSQGLKLTRLGNRVSRFGNAAHKATQPFTWPLMGAGLGYDILHENDEEE